MKKLEIGSGPNPVPGYEHLDVDARFPHLEYVCDVSKERLPIEDSSYDEVLMSHVIEHIPWRKLGHVAKEILRILKPGGSLLIRTPNLGFIVERYLSGEITPEWPGDEEAMKDVFGVLGPAQWTNIKLFSGQDYPSNYHYNCFDRKSIEQFFKHQGFSSVVDHHWPKEISPGELQVRAIKA